MTPELRNMVLDHDYLVAENERMREQIAAFDRDLEQVAIECYEAGHTHVASIIETIRIRLQGIDVQTDR
jgi:hypothetical protein